MPKWVEKKLGRQRPDSAVQSQGEPSAMATDGRAFDRG